MINSLLNFSKQFRAFNVKPVNLLQVNGNTGADGSGNFTRYSGSVSVGNYRSKYHVVQVANARDPSICEVYILFYSEVSKYQKYFSLFYITTFHMQIKMSLLGLSKIAIIFFLIYFYFQLCIGIVHPKTNPLLKNF